MIAALVPAAGRSERMGRPKLTLPVGGVSLIARVVAALRAGGADRVVVVTPPADTPGASKIIVDAEGEGGEVVVLDRATADMRATFERGLDHLEKGPRPVGLLLCPGDSPGISAPLVERVVFGFQEQTDRIIIPTYHGTRGHPVALPWRLAVKVRRLPVGVGVNALIKAHADRVLTLDLGDPNALADMDTPEDYARWSR
ncbi:MAG: nucleotidyltransferase family protein [Isosphaeraceae bacterium]